MPAEKLLTPFWRSLLVILLLLCGAVLSRSGNGVAAQEPQSTAFPAELTIHHSLKVLLDPQTESIRVEDTITLPPELDAATAEFSLNSNLRISSSSAATRSLAANTGGGFFGSNSSSGDEAPVTRYATGLAGGNNRLVLGYTGRINQPITQNSAEYAQSFAETSGIISSAGVYLNGASHWIPDFDQALVTFDLAVSFTAAASNWTAVSQGSRRGRNGWQEEHPMEEVYLVAAPFTEYSVASGSVELLAYLRTADANLANRYIDAAERYLALYEPLLGEYPYSKFALLENFWETGYGMPSFTLLGEQVIRLPFIIDSSYPHEILHNWWGNGVYPDYASGNWSEGLTAYLADHLFQEMDGLAVEYRKDNLIRYRNYVAAEQDFPLREFTSRNSAATQAVGYGKSLMLWHMLRLEIGDAQFLAGLRQLYEQYQFRPASFTDIANLFSTLTGRDLQPFFAQWVDRTGAPELRVSVENANGNSARIMFAQVQADEPYALTVPVALYYRNQTAPQLYNISLSQKFEGVVAPDWTNLQAVVVDPYFDIFRTLGRAEIPPVIGQLFGAGTVTFVLPAENRAQWRELAQSFAQGVDARIVGAEELTQLPTDNSVWVLGKSNPFAADVATAAAGYGVALQDNGIRLNGELVEFANRSTVVVTTHPANAELALGLIHIEDMVALPGMIEKLPHYGKYSYLSFTGSEPTNDIKGTWTNPNSPMQWLAPNLPAGFALAPLPPVAPLASLPPKYLPEQLQRHVSSLTAAGMAGRKAGSAGAERAAAYIAEQFRDSGLQPAGGSYLQQWTQQGADGDTLTLRNVIAVLPGSDPTLSDKPLVVAAHYDHLGQDAVSGRVYPGADDNASGVSIMLEVAAKLSRSYTPARSIVFVAFDGEEAGLLGSQHFVDNPPPPYRGPDFFAMLNLDSVGRLAGQSLQLFGADSAYEWPFMAQGIGYTIGMTATLANSLIASSDHVSFLNAGVPALHLFAGVHNDYHQPTDTPDKLDYNGMSDVARWLEEAVVYLGDRTAPLRVQLESATGANGAVANTVVTVAPTAGTEREASLGSIPDFAYAGAGVRLSGVTPGGAAEQAGLEAGDVLQAFNDSPISDLQTYSDLIRTATPGQTVMLTVQRNGQTLTLPVTLQAR